MEKQAVWALPTALSPVIMFVAKNDVNGVTPDKHAAQTFKDFEDALDEQTESNKFRRDKLTLRPMLVVI